MNWTREKLEQFPDAYRDFLLTLKPVLDSRDKVLHIRAISLGETIELLQDKYDFENEQIREMANSLARDGWLTLDGYGFMVPTAKGEELIRALSDYQQSLTTAVPPLPKM